MGLYVPLLEFNPFGFLQRIHLRIQILADAADAGIAESMERRESKPTRLEQQKIILKLFSYRLCDHTAKEELKQKAQRVAMLSTQPIYILREVLHHLLALSLPVPKVGRDRGCREPAGVSRCCGTRLGDFLAAHQLAGRV